MGITDELRDWLEATIVKFDRMYKELSEIADRIDAEHEKAKINEFQRGYQRGFNRGLNERKSWCNNTSSPKTIGTLQAAIEVTPHIDWQHMADEAQEFADLVKGFAEESASK